MPHVAHYLGLLHRAQLALGAGVPRGRRRPPPGGRRLPHLPPARPRLHRHAEELQPFVARYGEDAPEEPERLHADLFHGSRAGGLGLLRGLQDLHLMAAECDITWTLIGQAAQGLRDDDLLHVVEANEQETAVQLKWLRTRLKQAAPQALVVA